MTEEYRNTLKNGYVLLAKFLESLSAKNPNAKRNLISFVGAASSLKPEHATLDDWFEGWLKHRRQSPRSILDFNPIKIFDGSYLEPIEQAESFDYEIAKISLAYIRAVQIKKKREMQLRVNQLMKDFGISDKCISFVVAYLMFRWVSPVGNLSIKRNVSMQSFKALMEYENFFWAHYFPNANDRLKNYRKRNEIFSSSFIYDYTIKPVVEKNTNKPKEELGKLIENALQPIKTSRYEYREKTDFLNNLPSIKNRISDFDVINKLYPALSKKQVKQKVDQMKKIRERIKHIKVSQ